jgi:hypothetical protein
MNQFIKLHTAARREEAGCGHSSGVREHAGPASAHASPQASHTPDPKHAAAERQSGLDKSAHIWMPGV